MMNRIIADKTGMSVGQLAGIKNIIFDLGGVIIDIRQNDTVEQFKAFGFADFETIYTQIKQTHLFDLLETGKIPPQAFRIELRKYHNHLSNEQIDRAWNAMIGEMPENNILLLKTLRQKYRTFLLSNTNAIHMDYLIRHLKAKFGYNPLSEMFEHTYYSHEIGFRKPNTDIYEFVLQNAGLKPEETLFIDDLEANVTGARISGLFSFHLEHNTIADLFN
jgi:putative hydrolase of the HAD superfamily